MSRDARIGHDEIVEWRPVAAYPDVQLPNRPCRKRSQLQRRRIDERVLAARSATHSVANEADAVKFVRALVLDAVPPGSKISEIAAGSD